MNNINPVIMNINASLFQSKQREKELCRQVKTLRRQLDAERRAYDHLTELVQDFTTELANYAKTFSGAHTSPRKNGTQ